MGSLTPITAGSDAEVSAPDFPEVAGYRALLELGAGGMGDTWLGITTDPNQFERVVVLKRLRAKHKPDPDAARRFIDEARTAASVIHPNVVGVHQVGRDEQGPFLVLDYVEGATLEQLLDFYKVVQRPLAPKVIARVALDIARGLAAIHGACDARGRALEIVHRDLSLQNILVGLDGVTRIADFGIAKSALTTVLTDRNYLVGKLLYLPPEYLKQLPSGQALDVYSFGVSLWMALAGGRAPWEFRSEVQLSWAICEVGVPSLGTVAPELPAAWIELVDRACARDPAERFASGAELLAAILRFKEEQPGLIASREEVEAAVSAGFGPRLSMRRQRVAQRLSEPTPEPKPWRSSHPSFTSEAGLPLIVEEPKAEGWALPRQGSDARARRGLKLGALALLLIALAALIWLLAARLSQSSAPSSPPAGDHAGQR
ncbi:MAG: serine/threonine protein kinase [Polyangiaceae bacterium]|nr:serine/threonine protein kinase [Polyangiaceae bacterium]MCW5790543.1 serine/threonine protein kinase [Polyangiaceae bacterium]